MLLKLQSLIPSVLSIGIGGPKLSIDQNLLHPKAPIHKQVHNLPHISMNGVPLDDDPLTLDIWEDKEEHLTGHKREKRAANTPPGMAGTENRVKESKCLE